MRRRRYPLVAITALAVVLAAAASTSASTQRPNVRWKHFCNAKLRFCADFPYNAKLTYAHGAGSDSTKLFASSVSRKVGKTKSFEVYLLIVMPAKKVDPWNALTHIRGHGVRGSLVDPVRIHVRGHLAARTAKGLYGYPAISIYYRSYVYYLESWLITGSKPPLYRERFMNSIRFL